MIKRSTKIRQITKRLDDEGHDEFHLRIPVYLVISDSGQVSLEHLLLSWYPSQRGFKDLNEFQSPVKVL